MKFSELFQYLNNDKLCVQNITGAILGAKQRRGFVALEIGTDAVSMQEIASGNYKNVVLLVSIPRDDYDAAIAEHNKQKKDKDATST